MKKEKKLENQFTVNLDGETAAQVLKLAEYYQRKPAELLRLVLSPALRDLWAEMEREKHLENQAAPVVATFRK